MADYTKSIETAERIVIRLPLPTNIAELSKAFRASEVAAREVMERERPGQKVHLYDDSVIVEADEEEIRFIVMTKDWTD